MRRALVMLPSLLVLATPPGAGAQEEKLSPALRAALEASGPGESHLVWVVFRDKGPRPQAGLAEAEARLTPRALSRRALRGEGSARVGFEDLALVRSYVEAVFARVLRPRHELRWFNAVSAEATAAQVRDVAGLAFVERVERVGRYRRSRPEPESPEARTTAATTSAQGYAFDYGSSLGQVRQINVPAVHAKGLHGEGVVIALLDAGFNNLAHDAFATMEIAARRDFVNNDDDVGDGPDMGEGSHGTETLSAIGGFKEGELIGPAFAATYLLAKTENTDSETPVEEDNWAAAAEWAEGRGADVISSSLGYLDFDSPFTGSSYTYQDMDGATAISTRAAEHAASRGVVVVNSAGNQGPNPAHNTLGAPADGKRVLAVAAVTSSGARASFSSVGPSADGRIKPDVAAQGVTVKLASPFSVEGYVRANGTSFSCPLTAGVAALVLQAHPGYTVKQVLTVLRSTASKSKAPDNLLGYGIVNALAAVQARPPRR